MKRLLALLVLLASPVLAQVSNPSRLDLREEGASQGRIFSLNCVGTELLCAVSGGVGSITFSGASLLPPTTDTTAIVKGSADPTKLLRFEVDGFTGGTTRVLTPPNADGTIAALGVASSWSGQQTFSQPVLFTLNTGFYLTTTQSAATPFVAVRNEQTPDAPVLGTGSISNSWIVTEVGDVTFDRGIPQATNPSMHFVPAAQNQTEKTSIAHFGLYGRAIKALAGGAATAVAQIPVASGAVVGGTITFTAYAADATDHQALTGVLQYAAANKAGVETCPVPTLAGTALNAVSAGTLTCAYTCATAPTNAVNIEFNCVSSLTETTLEVWYRLTALGASEPLPQ